MNLENPSSNKPQSPVKPVAEDRPGAPEGGGGILPQAGTTKNSIPWQLVVINFALYLLLLDMAIETLFGGRSVRWIVLATVSVYLGVSAYVGWRYYTVWGSAVVKNGPWFSLVTFFALLYISFIGFAGPELGIQLLGLSASQVLALVVAITLILASLDFMRQQFVPIRWRQIGLGIALYGVIAYLGAFFDKLTLVELYGGKSFWSSLPVWTQGSYVGPLLLIPLLLLTQVYGKLTNKFAVAWLRWALNLLALSLCLGLVLSGIESVSKTKAAIPATITPIPATITPTPGKIKEKLPIEAPKKTPPEPLKPAPTTVPLPKPTDVLNH